MGLISRVSSRTYRYIYKRVNMPACPSKGQNVAEVLAAAEKVILNIQGDSQTPDEYRELCIRALALKVGQIVYDLAETDKSLSLESELLELTELTAPLTLWESFTSTAEEDSRRIKEFTFRENLLFKHLRFIANKLMLSGKYLVEAYQVAVSGVRFAEQCQANALVKNSHVPYAQVAAFLIMTKVLILKHNLKPASEQLAKAKFALTKIRSTKLGSTTRKGNKSVVHSYSPGATVLPCVGATKEENIDPESLEYLGIQVLHVEGLLHTAMQEYDLALESHAHEIIASSRKYDLATMLSPGYYEMANIYFKQKRIPLATSYYMRAAQIWLDWAKAEKRSKGENYLEGLGFVAKHTALQTLQHIVDMYSAMNESVRNRDDCLQVAEGALAMLQV